MNIIRSLTESLPRRGSSTSNQVSVGTTAGAILATNDDRRGLMVQNTGTTVIKLLLGTETPTQTVYDVALKACSTADDGTGGAYFDDAWIGDVQAISSAPGGTCVVNEIS
jgi:hypothetical protein